MMTVERTRVDAGRLIDFVAKTLQKMGVPEEDARITARILVATDLRGVDSHGVAHLARYVVADNKAQTLVTIHSCRSWNLAEK